MALTLALVLPNPLVIGDTTPGGSSDAYLLEDGSSAYLLEDGSSDLLMESA